MLVNSLLREVPTHTNSVSPNAVIANGPLDLHRLSDSGLEQQGLREAYAKAIQNLMWYSLAAVCVALPFALGTE